MTVIRRYRATTYRGKPAVADTQGPNYLVARCDNQAEAEMVASALNQHQGAVGAIESALDELAEIRSANLSPHQRACLGAAVSLLTPHAGGQ